MPPFLIGVMPNLRAWMLLPVMTLTLSAQEPTAESTPVLPDISSSPPVDTLKPVPAPDVPAFRVTPSLDPQSRPKNFQLDNSGGQISGNPETGIFRLGGPIKLRGDNGLEAFSDTAVIDSKRKTVTLEGNVSLYQGNTLRRGDRAVYHYETKHLEAEEMRTSMDSILLEAGKFTSEQKGKKKIFHGTDAGVTTADEEHPSYWVRGKDVKVYAGEKIVFKNLKLYAGDTPVFWLPYLSQPLDSKLGYHVLPGLRSNWGPFLLNSYGVMLGGDYDPETEERENAWLLSIWRFDFRAQRGLGTGVDLLDTRLNEAEFPGLSLYYLNDLAPNKKRSGLERSGVNEDRYRFSLRHRVPLKFEPGADWRLDTNLTYLSDAYYLEDFDRQAYRIDPFPDNTIGLFRRTDDSLFSFFTRLDWDQFYRADQRLPEIAFDQPRRPIFDSPVQHEGATSFSVIQERAPDFRSGTIDALSKLPAGNANVPQLLSRLSGYERSLAREMVSLPLSDPRRQRLRSNLLDIGYARFHTYQELTMPLMVKNFLSLTPGVGIGYNRYDSVEGPFGTQDQLLLHAGLEASVKFTKDYGEIFEPALGLNGLLHIFQPYGNWSILNADGKGEDFPMVDRLSATTRPQPLDPSLFTAIDEMNSWNILRLGARNRLLTKRDGQEHDWLFLDTYVDFFIDDPTGDREVSNLYNDLRWNPLPWMNLGVVSQTPVVSSGSGFTEVNPYVKFMPNENFEVRVGYRYLEGHPILLDSNQIDVRMGYRFNDWWSVSTRHEFQAEDGVLQSGDYMLHRDLGNWVAGIGFSHRDNRVNEEYGVIFSLVLKDFPSVSLPFEFGSQ
ncbi:MAG: LPS assembly protein LptD [Luteolibacter sp.]